LNKKADRNGITLYRSPSKSTHPSYNQPPTTQKLIEIPNHRNYLNYMIMATKSSHV